MSSPSISISGFPQPKAHRLFVTVAILFATISITMSFIPLYGLGLTSNTVFLGGIAIAIGAVIALFEGLDVVVSSQQIFSHCPGLRKIF